MWLPLAAVAVVIAAWLGLRSMESIRSRNQREAVKVLMWQLVESKLGDSQALVEIIATQPTLGIDRDVTARSVKHHWKGYEQKGDARPASALLSAVIDLPARWIEDIWTGRR